MKETLIKKTWNEKYKKKIVTSQSNKVGRREVKRVEINERTIRKKKLASWYTLLMLFRVNSLHSIHIQILC